MSDPVADGGVDVDSAVALEPGPLSAAAAAVAAALPLPETLDPGDEIGGEELQITEAPKRVVVASVSGPVEGELLLILGAAADGRITSGPMASHDPVGLLTPALQAGAEAMGCEVLGVTAAFDPQWYPTDIAVPLTFSGVPVAEVRLQRAAVEEVPEPTPEPTPEPVPDVAEATGPQQPQDVPGQAQPQAGDPQSAPGYPAQGVPGQGYPPQGYPGYPPQGVPPQGYPGYPPQGMPPQGYPGYPPQGVPGYDPQTGYPPQGVPGYAPPGYGPPSPAPYQMPDLGPRTVEPVGPALFRPMATRLDQLTHVSMEVTVEIGRTRMSVGELLNLMPGQVVELDRAAGMPADLYVNGTLLAKGEIVVVDEDYGLRVTEIVSQPEL